MVDRWFVQVKPVTPPVVPVDIPAQEEEVIAQEEEVLAPATPPPEPLGTAAEMVKEGIKEVNGEDLSDLFNVSQKDVMGDTEEGMKDLTEVSEEDLMGEGDPTMSDLVDVPPEFFEGYDYAPPTPKLKQRAVPKAPRIVKTPPPTIMGGQQR